MESEQPFGDEKPNFDICETVFKELFKDIDVLDVDAKTETAASSENNGRKSTENQQLEVLYKHSICTGVSQLCKSLMMTVKVEFSINTVELQVYYLYNHMMRREFVCVRHSISKLEPITGCKSETAIPRNIDGSRIGKTIRRSRYYVLFCFCCRFVFAFLFRFCSYCACANSCNAIQSRLQSFFAHDCQGE